MKFLNRSLSFCAWNLALASTAWGPSAWAAEEVPATASTTQASTQPAANTAAVVASCEATVEGIAEGKDAGLRVEIVGRAGAYRAIVTKLIQGQAPQRIDVGAAKAQELSRKEVLDDDNLPEVLDIAKIPQKDVASGRTYSTKDSGDGAAASLTEVYDAKGKRLVGLGIVGWLPFNCK